MNYSRIASVSLFLLLSCAQILLAVPSGNGGPSTFNAAVIPVFSTDFENVTKLNDNQLNMGISNWFEFTGSGGASMWMEGLDRHTIDITCHSGSRCVGLEVTNVGKSQRSQFAIEHLENLVGNELFVSVWLYLPADWRLHAPNDWYELVNPFYTDAPSYLPYAAVHIFQPDLTKRIFNIALDVRDISRVLHTYAQINNYPLPVGRWFNLQYYVYHDATNGIVKVWIDGSMLWDIENLPTENSSNPQWFTTVAKIYYNTNDTYSPYRVWADDLQIYGQNPIPNSTTSPEPTSGIPGFPWESILLGVVVGVTTLAIVRRRRSFASTVSPSGL
jgi:hypothetical protein